MYHKAWDGQSWRPSQMDWEFLGMGAYSGRFLGSPAAASWGPNHIGIYGPAATNSRNVEKKYWDGTSRPPWSDWSWAGTLQLGDNEPDPE